MSFQTSLMHIEFDPKSLQSLFEPSSFRLGKCSLRCWSN
uniref:Uncharacterized protein n=1 Tax=Rhizophora mucronata TaxID=61149 RepID=A0A2P2LI44_RHIMU